MPSPEEVRELLPQEFLAFKSVENIVKFERDNRPRIIHAPLTTFMKFIQKYESIVGEKLPYSTAINQPPPIERDPEKAKRIDPKSNNYGVILKEQMKEVPVRKRIDGVLKVVMEQKNVVIGEIAEDGYWEVQFQPGSGPTDPHDVSLSVNGVLLVIQRDVPVILPGPYLECADNGTYPVYIQLPNQPRKITGFRRHFPYIVLRRSNRKEYEEMLDSGNRLTAEMRRREEMQ